MWRGVSLLLILIFLVAFVPFSSASWRCGSTWAEGNTNCHAACQSSDDCTSHHSICYTDLDDTPCGGSSSASINNPPATNPPNASSSPYYYVSLSVLEQIMGRTGGNLPDFVDPLNIALQRYGITTSNRIAAFLAQIRHETASLTIFYQPADNGGSRGFHHTTPSNWNYLCFGVSEVKDAFAATVPGCSACSCTVGFAADPMGAATAQASKAVLSQPLIVFLSAGWWFTKGASIGAIFGWKGCGDLRLDADVGLGAAGPSDCHHTGYYQITCCIFRTLSGSAGLPQRIHYYNHSLNILSGASASTLDESSSTASSPVNVALVLGISVGVIFTVLVILVVVGIVRFLKKFEKV